MGIMDRHEVEEHLKEGDQCPAPHCIGTLELKLI